MKLYIYVSTFLILKFNKINNFSYLILNYYMSNLWSMVNILPLIIIIISIIIVNNLNLKKKKFFTEFKFYCITDILFWTKKFLVLKIYLIYLQQLPIQILGFMHLYKIAKEFLTALSIYVNTNKSKYNNITIYKYV